MLGFQFCSKFRKQVKMFYWNNQELIAEELDLVPKLDLSLFVSDSAALMLPKTVALEDARPHTGGSNTGASLPGGGEGGRREGGS